MKRLKNIYRRQISEHCGDPLAHPEYDTENVQMNYNDYEGRMAKQNLYKLHKYSGELFEMLHDYQEMESWVQEKIAKAADYISSVKHYLDYEMQYPEQENAFDDDTDLLHVGTSSGRSDFQGLRRINNTTTAVTTAITAQNEFIIEQ